MLTNGSFAVAVVKRQTVIVQAVRSHTKRDKTVDIVAFSPFGGEGLFLASPLSTPMRIPSSDILRVLDLHSNTSSSLNDSDSLRSSESQVSLNLTSSKCEGDLGMVDYMDAGMVKLPWKMYQEYVKLSEKQVRRQERVWSAWVSKH